MTRSPRTYSMAKKDYLFLESLANDHDCVEIDAEVFNLMADPTKARAMDMYEAAMRAWVSEHGSDFASHPRVVKIKYRWAL